VLTTTTVVVVAGGVVVLVGVYPATAAGAHPVRTTNATTAGQRFTARATRTRAEPGRRRTECRD
jgi:hypothetical protein